MAEINTAPKPQLEKSVVAKDQIIKMLRQQGYPTYARLLDLFDVFLLSGSKDIAYMLPKRATIVLNRKLNKRQVSTIVRHEILHEYLTHMEREEKFHSEHPEYDRNSEISNIAADFEISNRGYTDADKDNARSIMLGDETFQGLVTEDHYKDWETKTYEQMYKELLEIRKKDQESLNQLMKQMADLTPQGIEDLLDEWEKMEGEAQETQEGKGTGPEGEPSGDPSEDQEGTNGSGTDNKELDKLSKEIQQQAGELEKEIQKGKGQLQQIQSEGPGPASQHDAFTPPAAQQASKEVEARAQKIQDMFGDLEAKQRIFDEALTAIRKEQMARGAEEAERLQGDPLHDFNLRLNNFIKRQTATKRVSDYKYFNPLSHRLGGGGFVLAGRGKDPVTFIPKINVYWDVSWSFSDPAKTEAARQAINTLNRYAVKGKIKVDIFYHGDKVSKVKSEVELTGNNGNAVADHINETRPDNVIIITDGDLDWTNHSATVPGAVWMLFYGARSNGLMKNVKGKSDNQYFDIEW